jgi:sugar fermentation stimulation protein A
VSGTTSWIAGAFVERPNRFVVVVDLEDGRRVRAHLPNTGRLTHLTTPGRRYLLRPAEDPTRKTRFTAIRAWDGCWVALEAWRAPALLADWLAGHELPGFGPVAYVHREVPFGRHRIDLVATASDGPVLVEVKSGGRASAGSALLSQTPSTRAAGQLAALGAAAAAGQAAMVAFVVQRPDVDELLIGGDADQGWVADVTAAAAVGVHVVAYGCAVTPESVRIDRRLPVRWLA